MSKKDEVKVKGNPALKEFLERLKVDGKKERLFGEDRIVEIKGNPALKGFLEKIKGEKESEMKTEREIKKEEDSIEGVKIKGSPPVQIAIKEYYRRQGLLKENLDNKEEDLRDKYKNIARVSLPRDYTYLQKTRKKRKRRMVFSKTIRFDFLTLRLVRVLSRIMGISQSDFIRRAIISYARFIYDFLPEGDKEKIEKGEI